MDKKWPFVLSASVIAGALGSIFLHSKQTKTEVSALYVGTWTFQYPGKQELHQLTIYPDLSISVDGQMITYQLIELTPEKFAIQDQFGYHLILSTKDNTPFQLYDEADDITVLLQAIIPEE